MKRILIVSLLVLTLAGCTASPETPVNEETIQDAPNIAWETSPMDANVNSLITTAYSESDLQKICEFEGNIHAYNEAYPIVCIRGFPETYRAAYIGESCVAVIWFDGAGQKLLARMFEQNHPVSDYLEIESAEDLETVRNLYPEGDYLFLFMGRNDVPRTSVHYTTDGYIVYISYDSENKVEEISTELI